MELSTALDRIKQVSNKFAKEEVLLIREYKDAAIPDLLECVRGTIDNFDKIPENIEDCDDPAYAMYLLAEFKVHEAFDLFIRMLELDEDKCEWLLEDMITEGMGSLIASVADITDIERIKVVVENAEINEFQRFAALRSLVTMYSEGRYQRADLLNYLRRLLDEYEDDEILVTSIVCACEDVSATEHYERIRELFNDNKIDTFVIGEEHFAKDVLVMSEDKVLESLRSKPYTSIITDTVKSMSWWACFDE